MVDPLIKIYKMITKKLILTRGIQGSGKSTWARKWVEEDPEHRVRINNDDIRNMFGVYWVPSREKLVTEAKANMITFALINGYDVVVDNMNLNPKEDTWIRTLCEKIEKDTGIHVNIEYKDFWTPVEECIRRDAMRPNPIGEKVIRDTWRRYKHFIQTSEVERYVNNLKHYEGKPKCVVIDMDSTICFNMSKRPWYGEGAAEGMINDIPNTGVCDIIKQLQEQYIIVVATGRDTSQEEVTKQWLAKQGINVSEYFFRTNGDYRKGIEIKKEEITAILEKYDIVAIFEDCESIVRMYRDMGLTVLQPNKGL